MKTEILYIDMDNVLVDFPSAFEKLSEETFNEYEGRLDEVPGIFSLMEPLEGAKDAFDVLAEWGVSGQGRRRAAPLQGGNLATRLDLAWLRSRWVIHV